MTGLAVHRQGWRAQAALLGIAALALGACASGGQRTVTDLGTGGAPTSRYAGYKAGKPYQVKGVWYYPSEQPHYDEIGIASWYGEQFHNHYTADGEVFDMNLPSAAHKTLPLPSLVEVTNLANGRKIVVRVNDRGPFVDGRVIDMSREAAAELGFAGAGLTRVRVRYVGKAADPPDFKSIPNPADPAPRQYQAAAPRPAPPKAAPVQLARDDILPPTAAGPAPMVAAATAPSPVAAPPAAAPASAAVPDVDQLLAEHGPASPTLPVAGSHAATAPVQAAAAVPVAGAYEVQAGVFADADGAQRVAAGLSGAGLPEVQPFDRAGRTLYRVVVHGFTNPADAAATRGVAQALGVTDARVVALVGGA